MDVKWVEQDGAVLVKDEWRDGWVAYLQVTLGAADVEAFRTHRVAVVDHLLKDVPDVVKTAVTERLRGAKS